MNNRLINTKVAGGGGGCTDIVDNYDPFGGNGVALYQLNGNATDVSGNYNGTASNVTYGTGVFGQAGVFNGSSGKIELPTNVFSFSSFTLSGWVNVNANTVENTLFEIQDSNNYPNHTTIVISGGATEGYSARFLFRNYLANQFNFEPTGNSTTLGWRQYVMTYDGSTINCYINGVIVQTASFSLSNPIGSIIGVRLGVSSGDRYLNGSIDQVRIFNTALDPLEVEALYTEELCICGGTVDTLDILGDGSCIATYKLDGNANDLSGNYSGTPTNVSYGVGEFDLAGVFNGSNSKITIPNGGIIPSSGGFAISFWLKWNGDADYTYLFQFGDQGGQSFYTILHDAIDTLYWGVTNGGYGSSISVGYSVAERSVWTNFVISWDGTTNTNAAKIYKNGVLATEGTQTKTQPNIGTQEYIIGNLGVEWFNGSIDQVRIFNKALNSTEVTTLYNETACTPAACVSGTTNTLDILGDGSCIATYTLDGTPADLSGNYNGVQTDANYSAGKFDLGLYSNGTSTRINTNYIQNGQVFSVSFWGKNFGAYGSLIRDTPAAGGANTRINIVSNGAGGIALAGNYAVDSPTTGKTDWTHYVVTASGSVAKIYENTVEVASVSYSQAGGNNGTPVCIFSNGLYPLGNGAGQIDQVRIFNKALSAGEVTTLYNETPCN